MAQVALEVDPSNAVAWANLGDTLAALHQTAEAEPIFRHALKLDPGIAAAHYGLGNCLALRNDYLAALLSFQTAAQLVPNIPEFHFAQAFAHGQLGAHPQAIAAYRRAVTLRPSFASAWLNLGVELIADGRDNLAHLCYREALTSSASSPNTQISTHLNLGHLARSRRNFPHAEEHYAAALALAAKAGPISGPEVGRGFVPGKNATEMMAALAPEVCFSSTQPRARDLSATPESRLAEIQVAFTYLHLEQKQFPQAWQSLAQAEAAQTTPNPEIPNARGILLLAEEAAQSPMRVPQVSNLRPGFHKIRVPRLLRASAFLRLGWDSPEDRITPHGSIKTQAEPIRRSGPRRHLRPARRQLPRPRYARTPAHLP